MDIKYLYEKTENLITDFDFQLRQLSSFRQDRVNSYKLYDDKIRSLSASILLSRLLSNIGINENELHYGKNEHGKPYIISNDSTIHFNLSHSGDYALAVISSDEIGCDIQKIVNKNDKLSSRFFTQNECDYIKTDIDFTRLWCLKESFIKLQGGGLAIPLNSFEVKNLDSNPYVIYKDIKYDFIEEKLDGYIMAICKKARD